MPHIPATGFHLDLGSVPEWFGALSLLLAFAVFGHDRRNQSRAQVHQVGVWHEGVKCTINDPATVTLEFAGRNASVLPVWIKGFEYVLKLTWVSDRGGVTTEVVTTARRWKQVNASWLIKPADTLSMPYDHEFPVPAGADRISIVTCWLLETTIRDNAGRTWAVTSEGRTRGQHRWDIRPSRLLRRTTTVGSGERTWGINVRPASPRKRRWRGIRSSRHDAALSETVQPINLRRAAQPGTQSSSDDS